MQDQKSLTEQLEEGIKQLELLAENTQIMKLILLIELLLKWNKAYNLTAISQPRDILTHHILDSLSIIPYIQGERILDVGSGAGFPGIPCAILMPDKHFTLLDSNGKKTRFITQAIGELNLKNIVVVQSRVEDFRPKICFNVITARAFSSVDNIINLTRHLACDGGELLLMKGIYPHAELQKTNSHVKVYSLSVPGLHEQRHLVCIKGLYNE